MLTIFEEIEVRRLREFRQVCAWCLVVAVVASLGFALVGMWPGAVFEASLAVVFGLAFRRIARRGRELEEFQ